MPITLEELRTAAINLSAEERAKLAHFLIESLDELEEVNEDEVRKEWMEVAHRRLDEIEAGTAIGIPAEEVLRDLLSRRK